MTTSELKLSIFRRIDSLERKHIEELYGLVNNFLASKNDLDEWMLLSEEQQKGITAAIEEAEAGKLVQHEKVMKKIRKKLTDALHN